ncbi:hypothetical protein GOBAR_AA28788 [Gossypium barbadense]|uniref:Uncharacterized protein n=1 Tax=Gossypium barbadense TaxID=3634 RepID=A0A2P5WLC0_GOSBA|nr:hypothetical protein GOBAR_AA28788 [Gossypium barbadense]
MDYRRPVLLVVVNPSVCILLHNDLKEGSGFGNRTRLLVIMVSPIGLHTLLDRLVGFMRLGRLCRIFKPAGPSGPSSAPRAPYVSQQSPGRKVITREVVRAESLSPSDTESTPCCLPSDVPAAFPPGISDVSQSDSSRSSSAPTSSVVSLPGPCKNTHAMVTRSKAGIFKPKVLEVGFLDSPVIVH